MSLRERLTAGYAAFFLLGLAILALALYAFISRSLLNDVDRDLRSRATQLERSALIGGEGRFDVARLTADIFVLNPQTPGQEFASPGIYARVLDRHGNVLAVSSSIVSQIPIDEERVAQAAEGS